MRSINMNDYKDVNKRLLASTSYNKIRVELWLTIDGQYIYQPIANWPEDHHYSDFKYPFAFILNEFELEDVELNPRKWVRDQRFSVEQGLRECIGWNGGE